MINERNIGESQSHHVGDQSFMQNNTRFVISLIRSSKTRSNLSWVNDADAFPHIRNLQ